MKTDVEKAIEVDEYILKASGLVKDKRGYNALLHLLHTGVLMNERLGIEDTVVLCKMLNYLKFSYEFIPFGLRLRENSKLNFYNEVMYPPKVMPVYRSSSYNRIGKDDPEEGEQGWAERQQSLKNT